MADLIDRQAAIDEIENYEVTAPDYMQGWAVKLIEAIKGDIRGLISELPSVEPEIVRCKDCKYRYVDGDNVRVNFCELNHNKVQGDDWFCADAERRENEAD